MRKLKTRIELRTGAAIWSGGKNRPVVVAIEPPGEVIEFRLAGSKRTYVLSTKQCYLDACRAAVASRKPKAAARRAARC